MQPLELMQPLLDGLRIGAIADLLADQEHERSMLQTLGPLKDAPEVSVEWSVVNVDRVDASLVSGAREWRLVYFVTSTGSIRSVHLYEKPPPFAGVNGGYLIVVNGPSGAGKSTLIEAIRTHATSPWVAFDEPSIGTVNPAYLIWRETAPTLHRGFFTAMAALAGAGNQVALAAGGFPFEFVRDALGAVPTLYVGLDCPLEVLLERERGREGRWGGLAEGSLGVHEGWTYDLRFDSSTQPPLAMAAETLAYVARSAG